ncbi:MAG: heavy metal translocating P-type ATPase [Elusimicrobiota bacterium]
MPKKVIFSITGMHCASCAMNAENALKQTHGVVSAAVNIANEKAAVEYEPLSVTLEQLYNVINGIGYKAVPAGEDGSGPEVYAYDNIRKQAWEWRSSFLWALLFCTPLLYLSMGQHIGLPVVVHNNFKNALLQLLLSTPVLILGRGFYVRGIAAVIKSRRANMDTLIATGTGTAYVYSVIITLLILLKTPGFTAHMVYYETAAVLVMFMMLGKWLESAAKTRASGAIEKLVKLQPETVIIEDKDNGEKVVGINLVQPGDVVVLKPGTRVPVDGKVIAGMSAVDESVITGESVPVDKRPGDRVVSGTFNKNGILKFVAEVVGEKTVLRQIVKLVENAQMTKAPVQRVADTVSSYFVPGVIIIAVLTFILWMALTQDAVRAFTAMVTVMVVACPCALGLATPAAVMVATGVAAQNGILIKSADAIQMLDEVDTVVFDKTGTLTTGEMSVEKVIPALEWSEDELLRFAVSLEKLSEHPVAGAVVKYAVTNHLLDNGKGEGSASDFVNHEGEGVKGVVQNRVVVVGKKGFLSKVGVSEVNIATIITSAAQNAVSQGKSVVWIGVDSIIAGIVIVGDKVKPGGRDVVERITKTGKEVYMLTGDNPRAAEEVGKLVNIKMGNIIADVLPKDKAAQVEKLMLNKRKVAMVGDGINDAPVLAIADVGIAIGTGTDIAVESADVVLMSDNIGAVSTALSIGYHAMVKIKQNIAWAFAYNILLIPLAAGGYYLLTGVQFEPMLAGFAMAMSSVSVVTNSLALYLVDYNAG